MAQLSVQLHSTDKRIQYLEKELMESDRRNEKLEDKNYVLSEDIKELNYSLYELNRKQKELQKLVNLIPEDMLKELVRKEKTARRKQSYTKDRG